MDFDPVRVGVVGFGYWGPKLLRNLINSETTAAVGICEVDEQRRTSAARLHPSLVVVEDFDDLLAIPGLEAVAIATPVHTHYPLASKAVRAGKHVLVTKPFTETTREAADLIALAHERSVSIFVDHTFLFTAAVRKLRELVCAGELGTLLYYDSTRINLGLFQSDVNVIWDLAPHDFSILDFVIPRRPLRIAAVAACHAGNGLADVAYVTIDYGDAFLAHCHLNWLAPMKVRTILVGGSRRMVRYDDVEPDEKIRIYDRGIEVSHANRSATITPDDREGRYQTLISYRTGDIHAPWLDRTEALFLECRTFGRSVRTGEPSAGDPLIGLRVVAMLEAATRSLQEQGAFVDIDWSAEEAFRP